MWLVPALAGAAAVMPSVSGQLVWDDVFWARQIQYFTSLAAVLRPPADIPDWPAGYFRPVTTLSYLLDLKLHGPDGVWGRHVSNIVYHAISSALVWCLARRLLTGAGRNAGALAAGLLFAAHPIHTESVCWVGARVDVLATLFTLGSVLLALAWRDRRSYIALVLAPLSFLLAAGAKEVGVAGLGLVPLVLLLAPRPESTAPGHRPVTTWRPLAALYLAAIGIYVALRLAGAESVAGQVNAVDPSNLLRATGYYLLKLAWPWPQSNYVVWDMVPGVFAASVAIAVAFALAGAAAAWWRRSGESAALIGLVWTGMGLAPSLVVALSTFAATPVAERYLYLPSVGAALAFGALIGPLSASRWHVAAVGAAVVACGAYFATCVDRSFDWSSNIRLWSSTVQRVTTHGQPWVELGLAHYVASEYDPALAAFSAARRLKTDHGTLAVAEYHAGVIYLKQRDLDRAEQAFRQSRSNQPDYALAHYGLGRVYYERALQAEAPRGGLALLALSLQGFNESIRLSPGFGEPRRELARVLLKRGDLLAATGDGTAAAQSYRAGLSHLDTLIRALPALLAQPDIAVLRNELRAKAGA
jgi:tetratricopeptide (TPR) repeat protein